MEPKRVGDAMTPMTELTEAGMMTTFGTNSAGHRYFCTRCGAPRPTPTICPECAKHLEYEEQQAAQQQERRRREQRIRRALQSSKMGFLDNAEFDNWEERKEFPQQIREVKAYVKEWEARKREGRGLILTGTVGTGKSHLAMAAKNAIVKLGAVCAAINIPEFNSKIPATWGKSDVQEHELFEVLIDADLLVMDDMGVETQKPWTAEMLYRIVDGRYRYNRPIIATANIQPKDFPTKFGERVADRLVERCDVVIMQGTSYRKILAERRLKGE